MNITKKNTQEQDHIENFILWYTHENEGAMYDALEMYMREASSTEAMRAGRLNNE